MLPPHSFRVLGSISAQAQVTVCEVFHMFSLYSHGFPLGLQVSFPCQKHAGR